MWLALRIETSFLNFYSAVIRLFFRGRGFCVIEKIPYELLFKKQVALSIYRFATSITGKFSFFELVGNVKIFSPQSPSFY